VSGQPRYSQETHGELCDSLRWFIANGFQPAEPETKPIALLLFDGLEWPVCDRFLDARRGDVNYRLDVEAILSGAQPFKIQLVAS
jgi:hypothetical protein